MNENDAKRPILIVDDDKHFRYLVRESLEEEGLKVSEAEDGYQSLKIIEQCIPQLINLFEDNDKKYYSIIIHLHRSIQTTD